MTTKRRIVASNESFSSDDEGNENNLIEELNEDEQEFISPRKRLRSSTQAEEKSKDASESDEEIFCDEEDVDISSILSGKFKPNPFGRRTSERLSKEHETTEPRKLPNRRARRTKKFESHLQDYENNALPEKMDAENSRLTQGSEDKSDEDNIFNELSNIEDDDGEQEEEYGEYSSSESDRSFAPKDQEKDDASDQDMNGDSEMQEAELPEEFEPDDFDDLTPVQKPRTRKYATRSSARSRKDDASDEQEMGLDDISMSDEEVRPTKKRAASKRKREILSDEEQEDSEEPANSNHRVKKPRIIDESLSQHESKSASHEDDGGDGDKGVDEGGLSDAESIDLQSEAEEDYIAGDDDDFESKVPGDWRDFMDLLHKIEAMVEGLQSKGQTNKRRAVNKQYSGALEQLLYFTDHTNDLGQMFVSAVSHTAFLKRIARTWSVFLKEVGLRLEQSQIDSILRTFVRCHRKPYLKIASVMWKHVFTKKERVYALTHDELLDICSPKAKMTVEKQVQYLWLAKRLRNDNQDFESLMLCCALGEFYKHRYPKKRTVQITEWEDELHQRFVTHMLTLAASPLREINEMSLFNVAGWKYVSIVAGNPMAYMDLQLSEGVKRDFVTRFVLYYVIMYTRTNYFHCIKEKCEKLRRTIRMNINFEGTFECLRNPVFENFVRLAENGCVWLQNIVIERLLLFSPDLVATPLTMFKILVDKRHWDIAISSVLSAPTQARTLCKMMTTEIQDLTPLPVTARHMYIEVIEKRIRHKEKLTGATRAGIEAIGRVSLSMKIYLTAIGNAYEMIGHLKTILPSSSDLRLLRYHLVSMDKERDWTLIMNHVEDRCKTAEQKHEYLALRRETPFINMDANWIEKIFARSDVNALNIED